MIAPGAAARPRGQDDATSGAAQRRAHQAHSGQEEHTRIALLAGFRGLTLPTSDERSSRTSSPPGEPEHAGAHEFAVAAAETGLARVEGADPRKAAIGLRVRGADEAPQLPKNAQRAGCEPPLFSLSGGADAPPLRAPTMPALGVGGPALTYVYLQPADGGGGVGFSWRRARAPECLGPFSRGPVFGN
jgi:hypothetical protein